MQVEEFEIDGIRVGLAPIAGGEGRLTRREREKSAVAAILEAMLGAGAALGHKADGAPVIEGWNISITHSAKLAVVALSKEKVIGIDAEEWREALQRVKSKFLSASELAWVVEPDQLLRAWTIKEAVYKAAGVKSLSLSDGIEIEKGFAVAMAEAKPYVIKTCDRGATAITLAVKQEADVR